MILIGRRMIGDGGQFRNRHLESAVADDREHQLVGPRELRADGRRQAEAHGAEAAGIDPQPRAIEADELRRPHLVLADVGGDDGVAAREPVDFAHQVLRLDLAGRDFRCQRMLGLPLSNLLPPRARARRVLFAALRRRLLQNLVELLQNALHVAHDGQVRRAILADFGRIDVDVNHFGMRREGGQAAGHAIVEAHAEGDQQIGVGHAHVGGVAAVHARHADEIRMRRPANRPAPSAW